jgi:phosphatidylglycerophosphate synthase
MSAFFTELRLLPNQLTAARLTLIPILWVAALLGHPTVVGAGLALSFALDWGDGIAARRLGLTSAFGSRFDSITDGLMAPCAIAWLLILEPDPFLDHWVLALTWFGLTYSSIALGLFKFKRFANLHLQSARTACVFQYAFAVDTLVAPPYLPALLYAAAGAGLLASFESLVLQLVRTDVHERLGSILIAGRRGGA